MIARICYTKVAVWFGSQKPFRSRRLLPVVVVSIVFFISLGMCFSSSMSIPYKVVGRGSYVPPGLIVAGSYGRVGKFKTSSIRAAKQGDGLEWRSSMGIAVLTLIASMMLAVARRQIVQPVATIDRLSPREWIRMYRILGLSEDASLSQVRRATAHLRKKYAAHPESLERVEKANLWIMTRLVVLKEEERRAKQRRDQAAFRPLRRWLHQVEEARAPTFVRRMVEPPSVSHFRKTSSLIGTCAFLGLCAPSQIWSFLSLSAFFCTALVYQRDRPEPLSDDIGNIGEVRQVNVKELLSSMILTASSVLLGVLLTACQHYIYDAAFQDVFCTTTCILFWIVALSFKVHRVFD